MRLGIRSEWISWIHRVSYNLGGEGRYELWIVVLALLVVVLVSTEGRKACVLASSIRKRSASVPSPRSSIGPAKLEKIFQTTVSTTSYTWATADTNREFGWG